MLLDQLLVSVKVRTAVESNVDLIAIARKLGVLALKLGLERDFWHANYKSKVKQCDYLEHQLGYRADQVHDLNDQVRYLRDENTQLRYEADHASKHIGYLKEHIPPGTQY